MGTFLPAVGYFRWPLANLSSKQQRSRRWEEWQTVALPTRSATRQCFPFFPTLRFLLLAATTDQRPTKATNGWGGGECAQCDTTSRRIGRGMVGKVSPEGKMWALRCNVMIMLTPQCSPPLWYGLSSPLSPRHPGTNQPTNKPANTFLHKTDDLINPSTHNLSITPLVSISQSICLSVSLTGDYYFPLSWRCCLMMLKLSCQEVNTIVEAVPFYS